LQYLGFFSEDDKEPQATRQAYIKGELPTGELKKKCFVKLQDFVKAYQERRATITEEVIDGSMKVQPLIWGQDRPTQPDPAQMQSK
jgi:tryptophanyl-tRNA synthetase